MAAAECNMGIEFFARILDIITASLKVQFPACNREHHLNKLSREKNNMHAYHKLLMA
jgi:hypothetical protein